MYRIENLISRDCYGWPPFVIITSGISLLNLDISLRIRSTWMSTSVLLTNSKSQPRNFLDMRHGFVCHLFSACFSWSWTETYSNNKFMVDDLPEVYRALAYHQSSRLHIMFSTFALGKNQERLSHRTLCWRSALSKGQKGYIGVARQNRGGLWKLPDKL